MSTEPGENRVFVATLLGANNYTSFPQSVHPWGQTSRKKLFPHRSGPPTWGQTPERGLTRIEV
jgi:hypothetical protein